MQAQKTELLEKFAVRLKAAMKRRALTLQDVATHCGVGVSTVGAWTQGKNWPQVEIQPALAAILHSSVHFLIHGIPEEMERVEYTQREDSTGRVAEEGAPYGTAADIEREVRRNFDAVIDAAQGDVQRLHWVAEQVKEHLAPPTHWLAQLPAEVKPRRRKTSGLVQVILPSQKTLLSTHTGLPVASPSHGARSA